MYYCPKCRRQVDKADNPPIIVDKFKTCTECVEGRRVDPTRSWVVATMYALAVLAISAVCIYQFI